METRLKTRTVITARGVQTEIEVYKDVSAEYAQEMLYITDTFSNDALQLFGL